MKSFKLIKAIFLVFFFCTNTLPAQNLLLRIADNHAQQLRYADAVALYEKVLERYPENADAKIGLADAYHKMNDTQNAEYWYSQVVSLPDIASKYKLHYAQMLQKNGKCGLAKQWYQNYSREQPDDMRGQLLKRSCDYQEELMTKNAAFYEVRRLWFNSTGDDFSPIFYRDGLAFTSDRRNDQFTRRSVGWNDRPFFDIFTLRMAPSDINVSTVCNYIYTKPKALAEPLNSKFHEGSVVFSANEQEVFITKSGIVEDGFTTKGTNYLQLYYSRIVRGEWTIPELLPFNGEQFSIAHPAISPDGKYLYFSSDMPGGYGGMDLYRVERIQNRWGEIINLGQLINTEGNEVFPTCDQSGRLFFASDGQIGLGGLDIYFTEEIQRDSWSIPENMGYPINTISDDFGIIFNNEGTCGYFSSNRAGGTGGDDIYNFVKQSASMQVLVYDERTGEPLTSATVEDICNKQTFLTNANGKIVFDMPLGRCCEFKADLLGYYPNAAEGCTRNLNAGEEVYVEIPMRSQLVFSIIGTVFDEYSGLPISNTKLELVSNCEASPTISTITDASGRFVFPLKEDCCYSIRAVHNLYENRIREGWCTDLEESKDFVEKIFLAPKS
ncbi:MAG: tetratricopeptide repeat protein [Bacteroidota bacterium]